MNVWLYNLQASAASHSPLKPVVVHRGPRIPVWEPLVLTPEGWATPESFQAFETSKGPRSIEEIIFLHFGVKASMGNKLRALSISFMPLNRYCFMLHLRYHHIVIVFVIRFLSLGVYWDSGRPDAMTPDLCFQNIRFQSDS